MTLSTSRYDPTASVPDDTVYYFAGGEGQGSQFFGIYRAVAPPQSLEIRAARVRIQNQPPTNNPTKTSTHELGHGFGLKDETFPAVSGRSIMGIAPQITSCDTEAINKVYCPATPTPTPTPTPIPHGYCNGVADYTLFPTTGCTSGLVNYQGTGMCERSDIFRQQCSLYLEEDCTCEGSCYDPGSCSPIVVDVLGNGFSLTNANNGVNFNLDNLGVAERIGWTKSDSDDAWLALDRNFDGIIESGKELFGDVSPQDPLGPGEERNGFRALAIYDEPMRGGNWDGRITQQDAIFNRLRLWRDENHNGVSETCELFSLPDLGLRRIDLDYVRSERVDAHGNQFRYRSRVRDINGAQLGRWAWDVFLVVQQP